MDLSGGMSWPDDYIGPDSMTCCIIEKSQGFTDVGFLRISESIRAYTYLILSFKSVRLYIIGNMASALTSQKAFMNIFKNVVNCRVDIWEDIKHYQDTCSFALSKVNYSMGEGISMLPSDINLKIGLGTAEYNNEILVSNSRIGLTRNDMVIASAPKKSSHRTPIIPKHAHEETIALTKKTYLSHHE